MRIGKTVHTKVWATAVLCAATAAFADATPAPAPKVELEAFLASRPAIAAAIQWEDTSGKVRPYPEWSKLEQRELAKLFTQIVSGQSPGLPEAPELAPPALQGDKSSPPLTPELARYETKLAWRTFAAYVAQSLAVEATKRVPWSLADYSPEELAMLLDGRSMYRWDPSSRSYRIPYIYGTVTPGDPVRVFDFLQTKKILASTPRETIEQLIGWGRQRLHHFTGDWNASNVYAQWKYYGWPPVERMINGVTQSDGLQANLSGGCFGTVGFLKAVLRTANIPVRLENPCNGHAAAFFVRENLYLTHGDDVYDLTTKHEPPIPAGKLLVEPAKFKKWFPTDELNFTECKMVSRRNREVAAEYLTDWLLRLRCEDLSSNRKVTDSSLYDMFKFDYTVKEFEATNLAKRLDARIKEKGGCSNVK